MKDHEIVNSITADDLAYFSEHMSDQDKRTVRDVTSLSPYEALAGSIKASKEYAVWMYKGKPMAIFGIAQPNTALNDFYYAWMYNTNEAGKFKKLFYWGSKVWIKAAKEKYGELVAHCDSRNLNSFKWLGKLGFKLTGQTMFNKDFIFFRLRNK